MNKQILYWFIVFFLIIAIILTSLLLVQSVHLARRFSHSFEQVEKLSGELQLLNLLLEQQERRQLQFF